MNADLKRLAEQLRARYGPRLRKILFFGSRARGDASRESDYDCLLVFDRATAEVKADPDHLAAQWLLEQGVVLSAIAVSETDLEQFRYEPFLQNARRAGIAA